MTSGIFFSLNSLSAICSGSVSPSRSTSTGAFILSSLSVIHCTSFILPKIAYSHPPYLQSSRPQHSRPLILSHVWCRLPVLSCNHFLLLCTDCILILLFLLFCPSRRCLVARCYDVFLVAGFFVGASTDILVGVFGLVEVWLLGLVVGWLTGCWMLAVKGRS